MNAENFHEYLKNPSLLYQANYQELKSLVVQYPYSSNLRLLLLLKSLIDNHKDFDRNLVLASMYGIDRAKLFEQVRKYEQAASTSENVVIADDYLELKDLSVIEELPEQPAANEPRQPLEQALNIEDMFVPEEPAIHKASPEDLEDEAGFLEDIPMANFDEGNKRPELPPLMSLEDLMADELADDELEEEEEVIDEGEEDLEQEEEVEGIFGSEEEEEEVQPDEIDQIVEEAVQNAKKELIEKGFFLRVMDDAAALAACLDALDFSDEEINDAPTQAVDTKTADAVPEAPAKTEENDPEPEASDNKVEPEASGEGEDEQASEEPLSPIPTTNFSSWLQQLQPPQVGIAPPTVAPEENEVEPEASDEEERSVADEAKELAAKSVVENFDIATETLAAVLEAQGHYQKAIAMYERLKLKYPEKSAFFAAKIEELKSK